MKKSIKNTIMIGMAAVLIGTSAVSFSYAKVNTDRMSGAPQASFSQQMPQMGGNENGNGGMPGGQPSGNNGPSENQQMPNGDQQSGSDSNGNNQQPPEMPSGGQQSGSDSNGNNQQPPEMPSGDQQSNTENAQSGDADSANTNTSLNATSDTQDTAQMMPMQNDKKMGKSNVIIASLCYAFLALQIGIILLILVYLIMSKFNKRSFNEVFHQ